MSRTVSCELSNLTVKEAFPPNHVAATVYTRDSLSGAYLDVINKSQEWARFEKLGVSRAEAHVQFDEILAGFF